MFVYGAAHRTERVKAFIAIVLMASWLSVAPGFMCKHTDLIELFAGCGRICRLAESAGYFSLAHDMLLDKSGKKKSCMDINKSAGFTPLGSDKEVLLIVLQGYNEGVVNGLPRNIFVSVIVEMRVVLGWTSIVVDPKENIYIYTH